MLRPETEADLAEILREASGALRVQGGGTRAYGRIVEGEVVSVAGLSGITLYAPGALTLVAQAGTPLSEIEARLARHNQRLAFEPMDHRPLLGTVGEPTLGGVAAANVSGPRRVQLGGARDHLLGVRFVDGLGRIVKNGGRVMKNVTGYDLVKLMAGSHGTLGVLSEVSLKVLPDPEAAASLRVSGLDETRAVAAMSRALGSPFDLTGVAHESDRGATHFRIEGFAASVAYRAERLADLLAEFGVAEIERDKAAIAKTWREIRDVVPMVAQPGDVWRLSVKPSDAPALLSRAKALQTLMDWGGGLIWVRVAAGSDLRAQLGTFGGHATLIRASDETRAALPSFHPEAAPVAALTAGLRAKFDPRAILNPGLMG